MNHISLNDLSRMEPAEIEALVQDFRDICASGQFLRGPYTSELERRLSALVGNRHVVCVANGTDALTLAVLGLRLPFGSLVAVAPNAGGYSTTALLRAGLQPMFVDVDADTGQMNVSALELRLREAPEIKAVIMTHLYGLCGDVAAVAEVCSDHGLILIEDCAQSIGAASNGQPAGTFGSISTFSFYPTKNLGALGDAGAVVCRDEETADLIRSLAQYGWSSRYAVDVLNGFNSRMDEIQAAVLLRRLANLDDENHRRRTIVLRYKDSLDSGRSILSADGDHFVAHLAVMVSDSREQDRRFLESAGIETSVHYPILDYQQKAWGHLQTFPTPNAELLARRILTLPCHPRMTEHEIVTVCQALRNLP